MIPKTHLLNLQLPEAGTRGVLVKKGVLRNFAKFTGKHMFQKLFFYKVVTLLKKKSGTGIFLRICEISKNTFFYRTPPLTASEFLICTWNFLVLTHDLRKTHND